MSDAAVAKFCVAFTSYSWSRGLGGLGDTVAQRSTRAQIKGLDKLIDLPVFRERVEQISAAGTSPEVTVFLEAWRGYERKEQD